MVKVLELFCNAIATRYLRLAGTSGWLGLGGHRNEYRMLHNLTLNEWYEFHTVFYGNKFVISGERGPMTMYTLIKVKRGWEESKGEK